MTTLLAPSLAAVLLAAAALPAPAQTTVWSTPPKTEQWSTPTRTEQVDPALMDSAPAVPDPGPLDRRLAGTWDVWVPGGVWYAQDGETVYRRYTPGAAMNRIRIAADGTYRWGERSGRLVEVRPWHAQEGIRYYRVTAPGGMTYEVYLCTPRAAAILCGSSPGKLVFLAGGVGGHVATGTRVAPPRPRTRRN